MGYHPADAWESQCESERESYLADLLEENRFRDAREDSIYKFQSATKMLTSKASEAWATLWAKAYLDAGPDHESVKLAVEMELDEDDAYLILWMREEYFSSLNSSDKNWWMNINSDDYDDEE